MIFLRFCSFHYEDLSPRVRAVALRPWDSVILNLFAPSVPLPQGVVLPEPVLSSSRLYISVFKFTFERVYHINYNCNSISESPLRQSPNMDSPQAIHCWKEKAKDPSIYCKKNLPRLWK